MDRMGFPVRRAHLEFPVPMDWMGRQERTKAHVAEQVVLELPDLLVVATQVEMVVTEESGEDLQ